MTQLRNPLAAHRDVGLPVQRRRWQDDEIAHEDFAGVLFQDCEFEAVRFTGVNLEQSMFLSCRFDDCVFDDCRLVQTRWITCSGKGCEIRGGELVETVLSEVEWNTLSVRQTGHLVVIAQSRIEALRFLDGAREQHTLTVSECEVDSMEANGARWRNAALVGLNLQGSALEGAELERCCLVQSRGGGVDLSHTTFKACNFYRSDLSRARLRHAEQCILAECTLEAADLEEATLNGALFAKARAPQARFDRARMQGCLLPEAVLSGASFVGAWAPGSVWTQATLDEADLRRMHAPQAVLRNARLDKADVRQACLTDADLHGVEGSLSGADTRGARGTIAWRAELEAQARDTA